MLLLKDIQRTLALAWPIVLANAAVPLLGLVDTAVIGHWGSGSELAALALCNLIFNFLYWGMGFLRMSTTGLVAQAAGAGKQHEVQEVVLQGCILGLLLGLGLIVSQSALLAFALFWLDATQAVEAQVQTYFMARIWGAPAALALYVFTGLLIGLGRSRQLLLLQLSMTGLNIFLDCILVAALDQNVMAVGAGTAITEWTVLLVATGAFIATRPGFRADIVSFRRLLRGEMMTKLLATNGDLFVRTFFLLLGFAWFTNQSALQGEATLAANHILLGLLSFSAFFLDAFAFVAETAVGKAIGARDRLAMQRALWSTSICALIAAVGLFLLLLLCGDGLISLMTDLSAVRQAAADLLSWAALYVLVSVAAFQLDGIFIGATAGRAMRNASVLAFSVFIGAWWIATPQWGVHGLWASFVFYVFARAAFLLLYWRQLSAQLSSNNSEAAIN